MSGPTGLYIVRVTGELFVVAQSEAQAEKIAETAITDRDYDPRVDAVQCASADEVPDGWLRAVPFGDNGGHAVRWWVAEAAGLHGRRG